MIAAAAALLIAQGEPPHLAPVLDRPYRLTVWETRPIAGKPLHFTAERRLVFHREGDDLVAEMTPERVSTDAKGDIGRRFLTGTSSTKGLTIRLHLDRNGRPVSVDRQAEVWAAILAGVRAIAAHSAEPAPLSSDPAAPLIALSPAAQLSFIASTLDGICVDPATLPHPGMRRVGVPTRPGPTAAQSFPATEEVSRDAEGRLRVVTRTLSEPLGMTRTRVIDTNTGLLESETEDRHMRIGEREQTISSTRQLALMVR